MLIKCPECQKEVSDKAETCPHCGYRLNPATDIPAGAAPVTPLPLPAPRPFPLFVVLSSFVLFVCLFTPRILVFFPVMIAVGLGIVALVRNERVRALAAVVIALSIGLLLIGSPGGISTGPTSGPGGSPLLSYSLSNCHEEYNFMIAEGTVTNIGSEPLKNVQAEATFLAGDGKAITSESTMIDYNPILAGQTSPFKVMATLNPVMSSCSVAFKELMGGTITSKQDGS